MSNLNLPYNSQSIDDDDIKSVVASLKSDFLTTGPEAELFERSLCEYTGAKYAVVLSNATAALHVGLQALNVTSADTVLTTPISFVADANEARFLGAKVTFADVSDEDANLDPVKVR